MQTRILQVLRAARFDEAPLDAIFAVEPPGALLPDLLLLDLHNMVVECRNSYADELGQLNLVKSLALAHASVIGAAVVQDAGERANLGKRIGNHASAFSKKARKQLRKCTVQAILCKRKGGSVPPALQISLCDSLNSSTCTSLVETAPQAPSLAPTSSSSVPARRRSVCR